MRIHHLSADDALASLHTSAAGLTHEEAARRLAEFGPNQVAAVARRRWWLRLVRQFTHFFALILWLAAALAFIAEYRAPGQGMSMLGVAILGVIVINGLFSFWQEYRAERTLTALQQLLPQEVRVLRDGELAALAAAALVPGDVIYLEGGDHIPADCRLIEAFGVRVNIATITGESLPKARTAAAVAEEELIHARNVLLAGTLLVAGEAKAAVIATGMHTEFGKIAHLTQATGKIISPLQQEIARLSRWVALLATGLGVVFFALGQSLGLSFWANFIFAIGIIVANVPEGLLPTVTLALAIGAQRMARRNALIRHLPSVETLGSATVICTDKTGTLTENRMQVRAVYVDATLLRADDTAAWASPGAARRRLLEVAAHCHSLKPAAAPTTAGDRPRTTRPDAHTMRLLGDPLEVALVALSHAAAPALPEHPRIDELPFDSERRRMSTLHQTPEGLVLYAKGALEALLPLCCGVQRGEGIAPLAETERAQLFAAEAQLAQQGLRVIAAAYRPLSTREPPERLERDLVFVGLAGFEDPPRPEVPAAVDQCRRAGIKVIMVTGDHPHTAVAIARQVGLVRGDRARVVTGEQLARLSDTQLQLALDVREILFARIGSDQKRRIVAALKRKGEIVAVTGDGVNDAPALKEAHIGIAMGISGTDVAKESADMVLLDDNFASIVNAIEEGRAVFDNIRKFLTYILTSNVPEIVPYLAFVLFRIPLPLTIIQILAVDLGTDMLPALALGAEKPDPAVMQRPPRRAGQRLVDLPLVARAYLWLGLFEAAAAMTAFFFVLLAGGWNYGQMLTAHDPLYLEATTACLAAIIIMQVANVWLCRSERNAAFGRGMRANALLVWGIGVELALILAIVYTAWGNALFGTAPLGAAAWLVALPFAALMLAGEEARKLIVRRATAVQERSLFPGG
jgi:magnesium-transporting ATPase (P-type)